MTYDQNLSQTKAQEHSNYYKSNSINLNNNYNSSMQFEEQQEVLGNMTFKESD